MFVKDSECGKRQYAITLKYYGIRIHRVSAIACQLKAESVLYFCLLLKIKSVFCQEWIFQSVNFEFKEKK